MSDAELKRWNDRFSAPDYVFGTAPNAFLAANASRLKRGQRALCVADGEGRNSVWLAEQGLEVTAFDFSPPAVDKARRLAASRGVQVRYELASVYDWSWPAAAFDVVAAIFVQFADPPMRSFMFERMARALKPGDCSSSKATRPGSCNTAPAGRSRRTSSTPRRCCAGRSPASTSSTRASTKPSSTRAAAIAARRR